MSVNESAQPENIKMLLINKEAVEHIIFYRAGNIHGRLAAEVLLSTIESSTDKCAVGIMPLTYSSGNSISAILLILNKQLHVVENAKVQLYFIDLYYDENTWKLLSDLMTFRYTNTHVPVLTSHIKTLEIIADLSTKNARFSWVTVTDDRHSILSELLSIGGLSFEHKKALQPFADKVIEHQDGIALPGNDADTVLGLYSRLIKLEATNSQELITANITKLVRTEGIKDAIERYQGYGETLNTVVEIRARNEVGRCNTIGLPIFNSITRAIDVVHFPLIHCDDLLGNKIISAALTLYGKNASLIVGAIPIENGHWRYEFRSVENEAAITAHSYATLLGGGGKTHTAGAVVKHTPAELSTHLHGIIEAKVEQAYRAAAAALEGLPQTV